MKKAILILITAAFLAAGQAHAHQGDGKCHSHQDGSRHNEHDCEQEKEEKKLLV